MINLFTSLINGNIFENLSKLTAFEDNKLIATTV